MTPGQVLRRCRTAAAMTQAELARRAGTSQPVISAYEHDRRDPTIATLRRLLAAAGTSLELRTSTIHAAENGAAAMEATARRTDRRHADELVDVLLLADAIPTRRRGSLAFPKIRSR